MKTGLSIYWCHAVSGSKSCVTRTISREKLGCTGQSSGQQWSCFCSFADGGIVAGGDLQSSGRRKCEICSEGFQLIVLHLRGHATFELIQDGVYSNWQESYSDAYSDVELIAFDTCDRVRLQKQILVLQLNSNLQHEAYCQAKCWT